MKSTNFEKVGEFHIKFGLPVAKRFEPFDLRMIDMNTFLFRYKFLKEETVELLEAHTVDQNIVGIADALADLLYVAYGTAHYYGIPIDDVFAEVHRSNMEKVRASGSDDPRSTRGSALDVVKPPGWQKPNIKGVLGL